jgi:hypothetical protein
MNFMRNTAWQAAGISLSESSHRNANPSGGSIPVKTVQPVKTNKRQISEATLHTRKANNYNNRHHGNRQADTP